MEYVIGIDPGLSGAIAVVDNAGRPIFIDDMPLITLPPKTTGRVERVIDVRTLQLILKQYSPAQVIVEQVGSRPGEGHVGVFSFGKGYGALLATVDLTEGMTRTDVFPSTWKKRMGLSSDKEMSRRLAIELVPAARNSLGKRRDEGRAEALLLALYFLRQQEV